MSESREQLIQDAIRAFNAQDVEGIVAILHPEVEIELVGGFVDLMGERFQGLDGARRFYADWFATFDTVQIELERNLEAAQRSVALTKLTATAKGSDQVVELQSAIVYSLKDGKVFRAGFYYSREEALAAVGLEA